MDSLEGVFVLSLFAVGMIACSIGFVVCIIALYEAWRRDTHHEQ